MRAKLADKRTSASREHRGAGSDGVHQRLRQVPDGVLDAASYERMQRICMSKWQGQRSKWQSGKKEGIGDQGSEWAPCLLHWWELPLRRADCQTVDDVFLFDCALELAKAATSGLSRARARVGSFTIFLLTLWCVCSGLQRRISLIKLDKSREETKSSEAGERKELILKRRPLVSIFSQFGSFGDAYSWE